MPVFLLRLNSLRSYLGIIEKIKNIFLWIFLILIAGAIAWFGINDLQGLAHKYFPFRASVVETLTSDSGKSTDSEEEPEENEIFPVQKEEKEEAVEKEDVPAASQGEENDFLQIQENIDEITEKIDILEQKAKDFITDSKSDIEEMTEEDKENDKGKEEEDDEEGEEVGQKVGQSLCRIVSGQKPGQNGVIFNEIAWMGSNFSSSDEWVELKNISNGEINLAGWQILDKDGQIVILFSRNDTISDKGFYLLERTNDESILYIFADFIYTGSLSDNNEALYLFDENCQLQDKMEAFSGWPAGSKTEKRSMERGGDLTWHTYQGSGQNGILGTPRARNSESAAIIPSVASGGGGGAGGDTPAPEPLFCSQENPAEPAHQQILLNEIAWMGTSADWRDEWIELKNISEDDVLLDGWQILDKDSEIKIIFSGGDRVSGNGFYLLERTDDNSVPDIPADKIYTGSLEDNSETLRIFNKNCDLIDEITADPDWPAGSKTEKRSMERKEDLSWQSYFGDINNGILGTPKKENSQPQEPEEIEPPLVTFNDIPSLQLNPEFLISWQGEDDSGIEGFQLRYSEDKENWSYFPSEDEYTAETQYNFTGENEHIYYFQIKAKDKAGNESGWVEVKIEINNLPVVINEIVWMGTETSSSDEWIELFNNTNSDIDLSGWQLKAADGNPEINLTGLIIGKGFYLLERTDDYTLPDIVADQIYSGALGNEGEILTIYDNFGNMIEQIDCSSGWFAGDNSTKQTMERKDARLPGNDIENWTESLLAGGTPKVTNH